VASTSSFSPSLLLDPRDLRALEAHAAHETALIEDEGIDVAPDRRGRHRLRQPFVDHDQAGAAAELEAPGRLEIAQGSSRHEEESVAELLDARLKPVGSGNRIVVADRLAALEHRALADLATEHEARLHDGREDEDGLRLLAEHLRGRLHGIELV